VIGGLILNADQIRSDPNMRRKILLKNPLDQMRIGQKLVWERRRVEAR